MKPLKKREISKYIKKCRGDKKIFLNLWKRMREAATMFEPVPSGKTFDEIYKEHMKR